MKFKPILSHPFCIDRKVVQKGSVAKQLKFSYGAMLLRLLK